MRQDCVKDERSNAPDSTARTFGEAKQQFNQFQNLAEDADNRPEYMDYFGDSTSSFLEVDEVQYEKNYNAGFSSEPRIIYNDGSDDGSYTQYQHPIVHSAENVRTHDQSYSYYGPDGGLSGQPLTTGLSASGGALPRTLQMHNRLRRRQSRELQMQQEELAHLNRQSAPGIATTEPTAMGAANGGDKAPNEKAQDTRDRRKSEQMRSVSEDGAKTSPQKPVTRRSLSHPEKETQVSGVILHQTKVYFINLFVLYTSRQLKKLNPRKYQAPNPWLIF